MAPCALERQPVSHTPNGSRRKREELPFVAVASPAPGRPQFIHCIVRESPRCPRARAALKACG